VGGGNGTPSIVSGVTRATSLGGSSAAAVNRAANLKIKALEQDGISVSEVKMEEMFDNDMEDNHGDTMEPEKDSEAEKEQESAKSASTRGIIVPAMAVEGATLPAASKPKPIQENGVKTPVVQLIPLVAA
jgi:hypothetical protein